MPLSLALVFANLNGPVALELKARCNWLPGILVIAVSVVITARITNGEIALSND